MIQEKDFLYRVPVKNVLITTPRKYIRNPEILIDIEGGEFIHGNILDANSTNKLINQSVKDAIDKGNYATKDLLQNEVDRATKKEDSLNTLIENETSARSSKDTELENSIAEEKTRAQNKEKEISDLLTIVNGDSSTDGSFRKAIAEKADASALANEVTRATAAEATLQDNIDREAEERNASDNTITTNLNNEIARAKAAEKDNKDRLNTLDGDSNTEGSYRKAIKDLINGAPEAYDTLKEIADKIAENDDLHQAIEEAIATKASKEELKAESNRAKAAEADNASAITAEMDRAVAKENSITNSLDQFISKTATKEQFGIVKVGDGLNVTDGTVSVDPEYLVDMMSYGVEWDTTVADPACTRIGNPLYHKQLPIQSQYKGCLVKNGVVNYYLDPNDWSMKADGTPSVLDGTDGDVMVHIPKFYGKSGSNGNKRWVRISTTKIDSSWVEIPEMFVSAYRITTYTDSGTSKVASVVNTTVNYRGGLNRSNFDQYLNTDIFRTDLGKPRTNVSRATMRTNANNSGQELLCYEFYKWVFYWAYVIEYANFNSQKEFNSELTSDGCHYGGLGSGLTTFDYNNWSRYNNNSPITPCGYTNEFGNFSGVKQILIPQTQIDDSTVVNEKTLYANRWRGFENPFGDIWTNLDGIVLKRDSANQESKVYTTSDSSKFGDDTSIMNVAGIEVAKDGYTKEFDLRETGEIIPQLIGGSESTYKCDYHWCNAQSTDNRTLLVGGDAFRDGVAGLGSFSSPDGVGTAGPHVGFRSVVLAV